MMTGKEKVKLLRKFSDLAILAEENGLTVNMVYSSCSKSISYSLRRKPEDEYLIFTHVWVDMLTFEEADKQFEKLMEQTNGYWINW